MDLGEVFADVPRVGAVEGCTFCYTESELELLGADPASVPDPLVTRFATDVLDHWATEQYGLLWRGLAPRILGILEASPNALLLRGLTFAHFSEWPTAERAAVGDTLRRHLATAIAGDRPGSVLAELVGAAAHVDRDPRPWLSYLDTLTGTDTDIGIARLAHHLADALTGDREPDLFGFPEGSTAPIRDWLYSDALHERLHRVDSRDTRIAIAWM